LTINNNILENFIKIFLYSFPFSLFLASGIFNLYLFLLLFFGFLFLILQKKKIIFERIDLILFLFFFTIFLSTILNFEKINNHQIIFKSLSLFRFFLLFILIRNFFFYKLLNINKLSLLFLISSFTSFIEIILQYFIGKGIFGYAPIDLNRLVGFFYYEAISGSYLQKFFLISLIYLIGLKQHNFFFVNFFIVIIFCAVLLTIDRMPFLMLGLTLFGLLILLKKRIFIALLLAAIIFGITFKKDENIHRLYKNLFLKSYNLFQTKYNVEIYDNEGRIRNFPRYDNYDKIYIASINIFLNNFLVGVGHKQFTTSTCNDINNFYGCSTHPHNIILEIAVTTGILGLFLFVYFIFRMFFIFYKNKKIKFYFYFFTLILAIEIFPFRTYGSILTTINGGMFWFLISILGSFEFIKKDLKKNL